MAIQFYDVKSREKVEIDESNVTKVTYQTKSGTRYGLRAKTSDGRNLTKFVGKDAWDSLNVPVEG